MQPLVLKYLLQIWLSWKYYTLLLITCPGWNCRDLAHMVLQAEQCWRVDFWAAFGLLSSRPPMRGFLQLLGGSWFTSGQWGMGLKTHL